MNKIEFTFTESGGQTEAVSTEKLTPLATSILNRNLKRGV